MPRTRTRLASALAVVPLGVAVAFAGAPAASANHQNQGQGNGPKTQTYEAKLEALNDSGATGTATATLERNRLTVTVEMDGVDAGELHPQHIHGFDDARANATCPTEDAEDGITGSPEEAAMPETLISVAEGLPFYGDILLPLKPFPTPPATSYTFTETYSGKDLAPLQPIKKTLQNRHIVVHGDTVAGADGEDTYIATLPIACGQLDRTSS